MYHVSLPLKQPEYFNPLTQDYEMTDDENKEKHSDAIQKNAFSIFLTLAVILILFFVIWDAITQRYTSWPTWSYALCSTILTSVLLWIAFAAKKSINPQTLSLYIKKHLNRLPLFAAICLWVTAAVILYTALNWMWGKSGVLSGWTLNGETSGPLERIKSSLVIIGGIGGVGYLVIKYRERSSSERGEADEKLLHAVQQLGDSSAQVRIAGVYALTNVADTYDGSYTQRVVDILCGYLRIDRAHKDLEEDIATNNKKPRYTDAPVESTILSVLANHLRSSHPKFHQWTSCSLDLHGATLTEAMDFSDTHIGEIDARDTKFRTAIFERAIFHGKANFENSIFTNVANFKCTNFEKEVDFSNASFEPHVDFSGNSDEERSIFAGEVKFENTTFFSGASFCNANFNLNSYRKATFYGYVEFRQVNFNQCANFELIKIYFGSNNREPFIQFTGNFSQGANFEHVGDMSSSPMYLSFGSKESDKRTDIRKITKITGYLTVHAENVSFDRLEFRNDYITPPNGVTSFDSTAISGHASFAADDILRLHFTDVNFCATADFDIPLESEIKFIGVTFNSKHKDGVSFPRKVQLFDGLPEGAKWVDPNNQGFPLDRGRQSPTDEEGEPNKGSLSGSLPQDEGGEEDGDQDAQLVDGDDHTGGAVLEGPVAAEPGGTRRGPGGEDEAELTTRHSTDLPELPCDSDHHPGHHQDHPGADRSTEVRLHARNAGLTEDRGEHSEDE